MNLYEVIFYGAEHRTDDADTIYLVRAPDFRVAIEITCHSLDLNHHASKVARIPDAVFEIGTDLSTSSDPTALLLRGPYTQPAYNYGWRTWEVKIEDGMKTSEWLERHT